MPYPKDLTNYYYCTWCGEQRTRAETIKLPITVNGIQILADYCAECHKRIRKGISNAIKQRNKTAREKRKRAV